MDEVIPHVMWSEFDGRALSDVRCSCGEEYWTHIKSVHVPEDRRGLVVVARTPCVRCGFQTHIVQVHGDV